MINGTTIEPCPIGTIGLKIKKTIDPGNRVLGPKLRLKIDENVGGLRAPLHL
jgi:hypothetical protein